MQQYVASYARCAKTVLWQCSLSECVSTHRDLDLCWRFETAKLGSTSSQAHLSTNLHDLAKEFVPAHKWVLAAAQLVAPDVYV